MSHRIVVLAGGLSHERDVSIRSGRRVADALRAAGGDVIVLDLDPCLLSRLAQIQPDCVVPMLHGSPGEDGSLRDVLASLGLPYVGSAPDACRLSFDKMVARALMAAHGVSTRAAVALPHSTFRDLGASAVLDSLVHMINLPLVVKPSRGGSALGMSLVNEQADLPSALVNCFAYSDTAMLEAQASGIEVAAGVIEDADGEPFSLPVVEIRADDGVYDYTARYTAGTTEFFVPARLTEQASARCAEIALTAHRALGLRHVSRTDLIVTEGGEVVFLEANVAPGFTETSLLPQAIQAAGLDLGDVLMSLVDRAVRTHREPAL